MVSGITAEKLIVFRKLRIGWSALRVEGCIATDHRD